MASTEILHNASELLSQNHLITGEYHHQNEQGQLSVMGAIIQAAWPTQNEWGYGTQSSWIAHATSGSRCGDCGCMKEINPDDRAPIKQAAKAVKRLVKHISSQPQWADTIKRNNLSPVGTINLWSAHMTDDTEQAAQALATAATTR